MKYNTVKQNDEEGTECMVEEVSGEAVWGVLPLFILGNQGQEELSVNGALGKSSVGFLQFGAPGVPSNLCKLLIEE